MRSRVLYQGNPTKYVLYALGEIILIVIGILIAVGINDYSEKNQIRTRELFYLHGLKTEFDQSRQKLETLMDVNRTNYQNARKIAVLIRRDSTWSEEQISDLLYYSFANDIAYDPNSSLLNELIGSGRLQDISSSELRQDLTSWESWMQSTRRQEAALQEQKDKVVDLFRSEKASIGTMLDLTGVSQEQLDLDPKPNYSSNKDVVRSAEFENNLLLYLLTSKITEDYHYNPLLDEVISIQQRIGKELQNPE